MAATDNTKTTSYREATIEELKHLSPSKEESVCGIIKFPNPLGGKEIISGTFQIFDGIAYGIAMIDGEEREIVSQYPLTQLVNKSPCAKNMKEKARKCLNIEEDRDLTSVEIFNAFAKFHVVEY